jgi:uncharacterized protein with von Willebrand factor type A (vWA) domain
MTDIKEIKRAIRELKKLKLKCRPGSSERLDLEHRIKELKIKLIPVEIEPGKDKLIQEIYILDPLILKMEMDLNKFTIKELEYHIKKLKTRGLTA